jgi:hypothetical protein
MSTINETATKPIDAFNKSDSREVFNYKGEEIVSVISNPMDHLDALARLAPRSEYFAASAIVGSLGYSVINQLLWQHRKASATTRLEAPTIDIFNDDYGDTYERMATEQAMHDIGMESLPNFDALKLIGAYKKLLRHQMGNIIQARDFPVRKPHEILHEMLNGERAKSEELDAAYAAITEEEIKASPAAKAIREAIERRKANLAVHDLAKEKSETEYVLSELQKAMPEDLDDEKWAEIPVWMQYKLTTMIHRQVVNAVASESANRERDTNNLSELIELCSVVQLELEAAGRTSEVKLAFVQQRLTERHVLQ